jgi:hypothetical protein
MLVVSAGVCVCVWTLLRLLRDRREYLFGAWVCRDRVPVWMLALVGERWQLIGHRAARSCPDRSNEGCYWWICATNKTRTSSGVVGRMVSSSRVDADPAPG